MYVANFELSKELYELSGWMGDDRWWAEEDGDRYVRGSDDDGEAVCPAYEVGYLMRQLMAPAVLLVLEIQDGIMTVHSHVDPPSAVETPEDAICIVAIDLFKQGILKKEDA